MGAMELQIFVSLLVVLGAAFVALICDFLKGNNEKLREFNIELITRQEERERAAVSTSQSRRVGQPQAARALETAKSAEAPMNAQVSPPPRNSVVAEGIPAYPRRRRPVPQAGSERQSPAPVAAIAAMEDWAKRVVEQSASTRKAEPPTTPAIQPALPNLQVAETVASISQAEQSAEAVVGPLVAADAGLASRPEANPIPPAEAGCEIEMGPADAGAEAVPEIQEIRSGLGSELPLGEIEVVEPGPVQQRIEPSAIDVAPVEASDGVGIETPGEAETPTRAPALPMAGPAALETRPAHSDEVASRSMEPGAPEFLAESDADLAGLMPTPHADEQLVPSAGLQPLPEVLKPADAVRSPHLLDPLPVSAEAGAFSSTEAKAHHVQAEETLPLAETAGLPMNGLRPAWQIASPDTSVVLGAGSEEASGIPPTLQTQAVEPPHMPSANVLPLPVQAADVTLQAREPVPQALQAESPGADFSRKSGTRIQAPDWTIEEDERGAATKEVTELAPATVTGEGERAPDAVIGDEPEAGQESGAPAPDEVVRVRVLDEGDLIQPSGLMELPLEATKPAASTGHAPTLGATQWDAGVDAYPRMAGSQSSLENAGGSEALPIEGFVSERARAASAQERKLAHVPEPEFLVRPQRLLPSITFVVEVEQEFDRISNAERADETKFSIEPVVPMSYAPPAPPVDFEIGPVADGGHRFIELDNEPEMNSKVVQMPLPVQAAVEPPARVALRIPRGIHNRAVFEELASQQTQFGGVVFLVGVMGFEHLVEDHGQPAVAQAIGEATNYFDSLLNTDGFGCWIEESTFVMVLPACSADDARQISTHTAEGLWDYQLRSLGSLPLIFHWGSTETSHEHLGVAVERAREQMIESGRARKQVLTASGRFRRRVVNG